MIRYVLYIWSSDRKKYCYADQVEYQAKIIEGEKIRLWMKRLNLR